MKMKKMLALCLALCLVLSLCACGKEGTPVYVQSVAEITGMGSIGLDDRYPGMVVSENVTEVKKDDDKTVADLLVKEGDDVVEGQALFSYDTDELKLNLDKQKLELEQIQAQLTNYKDQITALEKEKKNASKDQQLQYTVQIQSLQLEQKEAELNLSAKQKEITNSQAVLSNATVTSPITGRIQTINENGMDNYGNPKPYITIQQAGSYRIKATLSELQRGSIRENTRVTIFSRQDENQTWSGTVTLVDYENPTQGGNNGGMMYDSGSGMDSSSKYPFYVELDSMEGLLMGQHVYLMVEAGGEAGTGLQLPSYYLAWEEDGETPFVWAESKHGKLEKRSVTLGLYDENMDTYEIMEGLTAEDYIAFPDAELCKAGAPTTHEYVEPELDGEQGIPDDGFVDGVDGGFVDGVDDGFVDGVDGGVAIPEGGDGIEIPEDFVDNIENMPAVTPEVIE